MSGPKAVPFHGILAIGNTKDEAVNRYRLLAQGKGVSAMTDASQSLAFVTHASNKIAEMFNPATGELDLHKDDKIIGNLEFEAQAGEVEATHYVCESGCGLHIVYDSEALVKHCPACTTAIASADDEDEDDSEDDEESEDEEDEDYEESDEDDESEEDDEDDSEEDDEEDDEESDEDDESEEDDESDEDDSDDEEDDEEDDDEEDEDDSGEPLVIAADSKEKAIDIYREHRQGIATAATTVEVEYMVCSSSDCNAHVITEDTSLTDCPACSSELKQPEAETAPVVIDPPAPAPAPAPEAPAADAPAPTDAPIVSQSSDDEEDEDEDEEDDSDLEVIKDDDEEEDEDEESESADNETPKVEQTMTQENAEHVSVDMLSQITASGDVSFEGLDLSFSASVAGQPMWTAFYNGVPVATASKADAGKNADIFDDVSFGNAVIAGARHVGVQDTLNEMGFKGITHKIAISSVVADRVSTQVAEAKTALDQDRKEHGERFMAALATAAIGINRGFFPDLKNPIKSALWNAVSSAGVKNAEVLIDNAFKASSDSYHTALFAKASEILANPLEVQESLSKAVLGTNYMGVAESSSIASTFEDRLENFGTNTVTASASAKPEQQTPEAVAQSVSSDARISSAVAGLGRRR